MDIGRASALLVDRRGREWRVCFVMATGKAKGRGLPPTALGAVLYRCAPTNSGPNIAERERGGENE